ncbi:MAG: hypothetical protein JWR27_2867 [Aeromicrobium sp.]|jgi:hypothetical protein|nr:hypothetical protein [Aeromicrobium sp.]
MLVRLGRLIVVLVLAGGGALVHAGPAAAEPCPGGSGVTVVVGTTTSCDVDGAPTAAGSFRDVGHALTSVTSQPGFVCQVDGAPASARCSVTPPSDAYWGLFWSESGSGKWTYASQGVGSLVVPQGGRVALVFQRSMKRTYPSVAPAGSARTSTGADVDPTPVAASTDPGRSRWVAAGLALALLAGMGGLWWRRKVSGGEAP